MTFLKTIQLFSFVLCLTIIAYQKSKYEIDGVSDKQKTSNHLPIKAVQPEQDKRFASK